MTAGKVMHGTRTPLRVWFWAAYLVATHHPGISAKQLQRQLRLTRSETSWLILQKLRRAMIAPEREPPKGEVEVDEFFLGGVEEGQRGGRQRGEKRSAGSQSRSEGGARGDFASRSWQMPPRSPSALLTEATGYALRRIIQKRTPRLVVCPGGC